MALALEGVAMEIIRAPPSRDMAILLLASSQDSASVNLHRAMLGLGGWSEPTVLPHGTMHQHLERKIHLVLIEQLHIHANGIDSIHEENADCEIEEVLILSRHVSATNTPALTLHAIGIPGETPHGDEGQAGGKKGTVVPPSPRFASLFRGMLAEGRSRGLDKEYDLTLETTHHGPVLTKPTLYIEIGSTEKQWNSKEAADAWASVIAQNLGLKESEPVSWREGGDVMIGLGGGHYAPRHKAVLSGTNLWAGHLLANYALPFETPEDGQEPSGAWRHSIQASVESTRTAFPGGNLFAHLDRKSFKGWQRTAILSLLEELEVPVRRGKDLNQHSQL